LIIKQIRSNGHFGIIKWTLSSADNTTLLKSPVKTVFNIKHTKTDR